MTDHIAPTIERLRKGEFDKPEQSATVQRVAYRAKGPFERFYNRGVLTFEQLQVANKIDTHHKGAMGVRTSYEDAWTGSPDVEYARTYHAQKLAQARDVCLPHQWGAIMMVIEVDDVDLKHVGRMWTDNNADKAAASAGKQVIKDGLDLIGRLWGMTR